MNEASGDPYGTRTRVFAVRGRRPRPLDEGRNGNLALDEGSIDVRAHPVKPMVIGMRRS